MSTYHARAGQWTFDGEDPPEEVSGGEPSIGVGGLTWLLKIDVVRCVRCGRLDEGVLQFRGKLEMLDGFVLSKISLRQVVSKVACVFDLRGLLAHVLANLRLDTRRTPKAVNTWDEAVRGQGFQRV
jgi:hypothetical protein